MDTWQFILVFSITFIFGFLLGRLVSKQKTASGTIVINTIEADADRYSLLIEDPLDELPRKEAVVLKVQVMKPQ